MMLFAEEKTSICKESYLEQKIVSLNESIVFGLSAKFKSLWLRRN